MTLLGQSRTFLDYLEAIPDGPNHSLAHRLFRLGRPHLAWAIAHCGQLRRLSIDRELVPLRCRKQICEDCRKALAVRRRSTFQGRLASVAPFLIYGCHLTLTDCEKRRPLGENSAQLHRGLRAFTTTRRYLELRRNDPRIGTITSFELKDGKAGLGHPHGHAFITSGTPGTATNLAQLWLEYWLRKHPQASRAAQNIRSEVSTPMEIAGVISYVTKGTQIDLGWPDEILLPAVDILTSGFHLVTATGAFRKQPIKRMNHRIDG